MQIPKVYYSFADDVAAKKVIIMEDLSQSTNSGYYYGPGNPNNWGIDVDKLTQGHDVSET